MKFCIELTRKPGTMNPMDPTQQQRTRRMHFAAKDSNEALALAKVEAKRTGLNRYFEIQRVRQI